MLSQFCLRLSCGLALALLVTSPSHVASGFFRVQLLVVLALTVLAGLGYSGDAGGTALGLSLVILSAVASFAGSVAWSLERQRFAQAIVALLAGMTAIAAVLAQRAPEVASVPRALGWLDPLAGALVLGTTLTAMLLGHWYLVTPTMSLAPLRRLVGLMGAALLLRALLAAIGASVLVAAPAPSNGFARSLWVWGGLRLFAGFIGAGVVVFLAWQTVKIRSTQSATGILYVGVIVVFLGEIAAQVLYRRVGLPL